jgi:hypothetical protein
MAREAFELEYGYWWNVGFIASPTFSPGGIDVRIALNVKGLFLFTPTSGASWRLSSSSASWKSSSKTA